MNYLPDINLWLALVFQSHVHHVRAASWFEGIVDDHCAFCRLTQQGFLRLATNPKAFGDEAVPMDDAWKLYDALCSDPRVTWADEPMDVESSWRKHTSGRVFRLRRGTTLTWRHSPRYRAAS
jgi:toxin-antitoxin system PIN domain toxin